MNKPFRSGARGRAILVVATVVAALSGCADMSGIGGNNQFACKAPAGVQCNSVSGNYANSIQNNLPFQRAEQAKQAPAAAAVVTLPAAPQAFTTGAGDALDPGLLRSPARVLRMWVNKWEDLDHDLVDQAYVYMQVDAGRWMVEHAQARTREAFAPVRAAEPAPQLESTSAPPVMRPPQSEAPPAPAQPSEVAAVPAN